MGGKSRKKGGLSKKLVKQLMAQYGNKDKSKVSKQVKGFFDLDNKNESVSKKTEDTEDSS